MPQKKLYAVSWYTSDSYLASYVARLTEEEANRITNALDGIAGRGHVVNAEVREVEAIDFIGMTKIMKDELGVFKKRWG